MALTYLTTIIQNPSDPNKKLKRRIVIDSGATYSVLPAKILKKLKIKPDTTQKFILTNGMQIQKKVGEARITINNLSRTCPIIFGDDNIYVLGRQTLESFGLTMDPINRKLHPFPMLL